MLQLERVVRGKVKEKGREYVNAKMVRTAGSQVQYRRKSEVEGGEQKWSEKVKRRENDKIFKLLLKFGMEF